VTTETPTATLTIDGFEPDAEERWVIHSALLAQIDDMHAGGVYSWTKAQVAAAWRILAALTGTELGETPEGYGESVGSKVIVSSLLVPLYDLDHPELQDAEWAEGERLISLLTPEFGR
jgi:hypothetical protein